MLFSFIVNTILSTQASHTVGHWISIVIHYIPHRNRVIFRYFDSFGQSHNTYKLISKYINLIKERCKKHGIVFAFDSMSRGLQNYNSNLCGVYAAYAIIKAYEHKNKLSLKEIFQKFGGNRGTNDLRVARYLETIYPVKYCHDFEVYDNRKASLADLASGHKVPPPFCPKKTLNLSKCFKTALCKCRKKQKKKNSKTQGGCCKGGDVVV